MYNQYLRLKRHYDHSVKNYDYISFLDLAHTLRIWCEMVDDVNELCGKEFKTSNIPKKLKRKYFTGSEFIFIHFPENVITYAINPDKINNREIISYPKGKQGTAASWNSIDIYGGLTVEYLYVTSKDLSKGKNHDAEIKNLVKLFNKIQIEKVEYSSYLTKPLIYFKLQNNDKSFISRSNLIKRTANEYEASHSGKEKFEQNNVYSAPVKRFMDYKCADLPLPYFALLHIANDIINNLKDAFIDK